MTDSHSRASNPADSPPGPAKPRRLADDLRRILPLWSVLLIAAVAVLIGLGKSGSRVLVHLAYTSPNAQELAQVYRADGMRGWRKCLDRVYSLRGAQPRLETAAGALRGDATLKKAESDLLKAQSLFPHLEDVSGLLADLALWDGRPAQSYAWLGDQAARKKEWEIALAQYQAAHRMGENTAQVQEGRMEALLRLKRLDEASSVALTLQNAPDVITNRYFRLLAELHGAQGKLAEQEQALLTAIERDPMDDLAVKTLGDLYSGSRRKTQTFDFYEQALRQITNDPNLWHRQALIARELEKTDEAIRCYRQALKLMPNSFILHLELGQYYLQLGRKQSAQPHLRRAMEINPDHFARIPKS